MADPQPQHSVQPDPAIIAAVAAVLAAGGSVATLSAALSPLLAGAPLPVVVAVLRAIHPERNWSKIGRSGSAYAQTLADERFYRAAFLLNAVERVQTALGADPEKPRVAALADALSAERRYWQQHKIAMASRKEAARQVDQAAADYGPLLGWYAQPTGATAECTAAHGRNFRVTQRPVIGWPGSVHPHCKCRPGAPFATRISVDQATRGVSHAA